MSEFRRRSKGRVAGELPGTAAALLDNLARQVAELLSDGESTERSGDPLEAMLDFDRPRSTPDDPALRRLLPDAHSDDDEVAAEFRRYTEADLRQRKIADAVTLITTLEEAVREAAGGDEVDPRDLDDTVIEFELSPEQARQWMRALNDIRLALSERLEVTQHPEEYWDLLPEADERRPMYEIYGWVGYLLESLVVTLR